MFLLIVKAGQTFAATTPPEIEGEWEVTTVAVDQKDQPHWRYEPNDPRLLGRILELSRNGKIMFNFQNERCERVSWSSAPEIPLSELLKKYFIRPARPRLERGPTLSDFGLRVKDQIVEPLTAFCDEGTTHGNRPQRWGDAWFVHLGNHELLIGYDNDSLLLLRRHKQSDVPIASFSCAGVLDSSESAICSSHGLAGFDRSVAAAYRRSLQRHENRGKILEEYQRHWLKTRRNSCESDVSCLEETMRNRIDSLMQD